MQGGRGKIRVVPKRHNPTLRYNFRDPFAFRYQWLQRVQIVTRHPRQRQVVSRRQHIRYKNHRAMAAGYFYRLDIRVMTRNAHHGNTGNNLHIAINEPPLPCLADGYKSVREVARAVALRRIHGVFELRSLHDVLRVRKSWHIASADHVSISAGVIKLQVGVDDHIDFLSSDAQPRERISQSIAFLAAVNTWQLGC